MRTITPRTPTRRRHPGSTRIRAAVGAGVAAIGIGIASCTGWPGPTAGAATAHELRVTPVSWSVPTEKRTPRPTVDDLERAAQAAEQAAQRAERAAEEAEKAAAKAAADAKDAGTTADTWRLGYDNALRLYHAEADELARAEKAEEQAWATSQEAYARYQAQPWYERLWPGDLEHEIWQRARDAWHQAVLKVVSLRAQAEEAAERVHRVHQDYLTARDDWTTAQLHASRASAAADTLRHEAQEARQAAERARERADRAREAAEGGQGSESDTRPPGPEQPEDGADPGDATGDATGDDATGDDATGDDATGDDGALSPEPSAGFDPGPARPVGAPKIEP
jgi:hypothetical protein